MRSASSESRVTPTSGCTLCSKTRKIPILSQGKSHNRLPYIELASSHEQSTNQPRGGIQGYGIGGSPPPPSSYKPSFISYLASQLLTHSLHPLASIPGREEKGLFLRGLESRLCMYWITMQQGYIIITTPSLILSMTEKQIQTITSELEQLHCKSTEKQLTFFQPEKYFVIFPPLSGSAPVAQANHCL